ncbi:glycoside hydrolase family 43 protein [Kribbella deserti]|uniref:Glycoside hydrolase family 43 protein n=1 Tax=Kribbella deserti TaxID=1926257 RepID=A0ABV6QEU1_9ACTN
MPTTRSHPLRKFVAGGAVLLAALTASALPPSTTPAVATPEVAVPGAPAGSDAADGLETKAPYSSFRPGAEWRDTSGKLIQAHGGQLVPATDDQGRRIWYWYGEDRSKGYYDSPGVHVYASYDLYNWKDEGLALRAMSSPDQFEQDKYFAKLYKGYSAAQKEIVWRDLSTNAVRTDGWAKPSILERPKVIYNKATGKWVMWVHSDGPSSPTSTSTYARAEAGVAVSNSPKGPFRWIDSYRLNRVPSDSVPWCGTSSAFDPAGGMARDMNLFVDDDGSGYIIYSSEENRTMYISKLRPDYLYLSAKPEDAVQGKDFVRTLPCNQREAPAMFKTEGTYYLITSGATGWDPNPARYATAQSILSQWTDRGNPISGDGAANTYRSQSTSVIPYDAKAGKFIYMGDRWTPNDLASSPYVWLPLRFGEGGTLSIGPDQEWKLGDLQPYQRWTVDTVLPDHVWLADTSTLPGQVSVKTATGSTRLNVTWDASTIAQPGPANLRGSLSDGRTFTRSVVVVPHGLRYVVNAGGANTPDWKRMAEAAATEGPLLNSSPEQPLGTDPVTGKTWGYTGASAPAGTATGDLYSTLRYAKNHEPLVYTFEGLEPGTYTVHAGYFDPWPWANRAAQVSVNGSVVDQQRLFTGTNTAASYPGITAGADGKITVTIAPTRSPDIQISWLLVARSN